MLLLILEENCTCVTLLFLSLHADTKTVISAIDRILDSSETHDMDECESALEALGQIGSCKYATHFLGLGEWLLIIWALVAVIFSLIGYLYTFPREIKIYFFCEMDRIVGSIDCWQDEFLLFSYLFIWALLFDEEDVFYECCHRTVDLI